MKRFIAATLAFWCANSAIPSIGRTEELDPLRKQACQQEATQVLNCLETNCDCKKIVTAQNDFSNSVLNDDAFQKILKFSAMLLKSDIKEPLKFAVHTPTMEEIESRLSVTVCGHVCNGNVCYEDDSTSNTPSPSDIQIDSITVQDGAPPMPMLTLSKMPKSTLATNEAAEVSLNAPLVAEVKSLEVENAELRAKLIALENEIELRKEHSKEIRELLADNTELSIRNAELSASQEATEGVINLLIEKNELAAELHVMKTRVENSSDNVQTLNAETVAALVQMIEDVRNEVRALSTASFPVASKPGMPVPIAPSTYIPTFPEFQAAEYNGAVLCTKPDCQECQSTTVASEATKSTENK